MSEVVYIVDPALRRGIVPHLAAVHRVLFLRRKIDLVFIESTDPPDADFRIIMPKYVPAKHAYESFVEAKAAALLLLDENVGELIDKAAAFRDARRRLATTEEHA